MIRDPSFGCRECIKVYVSDASAWREREIAMRIKPSAVDSAVDIPNEVAEKVARKTPEEDRLIAGRRPADSLVPGRR